MVVARMLLDPSYAAGAEERFAAEVVAMHRRLTGPVGLDGRLQLPWPRIVGTPPWAVAHQLSATGGPHLDPTPYAVHLVRHRPAAAPPLLHHGSRAGRPVALYVGDRWLPRHVVLAVGPDPLGTEVYDPARGTQVTVPDADLNGSRLGFGRWTHPWFVVAPR